MLEAFDIALHRPENTLVIVCVRNRNQLHSRIFLNVHHIGLVILVHTIVQLVVLVIPYYHIAGKIQGQLPAVTVHGRNHSRTLEQFLTDIGFRDLTQHKRLDLVNGLPVINVNETVNLLSQPFIQPVGRFHGASRLVKVRILAHAIDTA